MQQNQTQQLDQDVVNLSKAIRQVESGNKAVLPQEGEGFGGKSRYQYSKDTWKEVAGKYLGDPNAELTLQNENQATYKRIKDWKDQGYKPSQIASMWNAGAGEPDAYLGTFSDGSPSYGRENEYGVMYDVPGHSEKVRKAYEQIKNQGMPGGTYTPPPQPHQFTPAEQSGAQTLNQQIGGDEDGLIADLGDAFSGVGTGASEAYRKTATGEINPLSGVLQGAGALAGGVGNVIDAGLTNLPIVGKPYEKATEVIGKGIGGAMEATGASQWMQENPEAAGNIEAAMNIASVVPFLKSLSLGRKGLQDAATGFNAEGVARQATEEIEGSLTKGTGRALDRAKSRGLDPVMVLVNDPKLLPEVIERNGKFVYDSREGAQALQRSIDADEQALQNLFESTRAMNPDMDGLSFNINNVAQRTMDDVLDGLGNTGAYDDVKRALTRYFDSYKSSMRGTEFIDLSQLNAIKRDIRSNLNFEAIDPFSTTVKQTRFDGGQSLMRQVEEAAEKAGMKEVRDMNRTLGEKLTALDILEDLDGKAIKSGSKPSEGLIKSVGRTVPVVEGLIDYTSRGVPRTPTKRLRDKSPVGQTARKGLVQLGAGLGLSGL